MCSMHVDDDQAVAVLGKNINPLELGDGITERRSPPNVLLDRLIRRYHRIQQSCISLQAFADPW